MNIFKKFYQKHILGISYPIDENATATEKLYHIGLNETDPLFEIAKDALENKPELTYLFDLKTCNYDAIIKDFETKERWFSHYIIKDMIKTKDNTMLSVTWTYVED